MSAPTPGPRPTAVDRAPSASFGRAEPDGTVWVSSPAGERRVGQYAAGTPEEGLAFYARKYDDLRVEAELALVRLADGRTTPQAAQAVAARLREQVAEPTVVGDLAGLEALAAALDSEVEAQRVRRAEERAAAKAAALAARERIVVEAESLAASTQWKPTGERFRALLEEWKALPHGDRATEQELWKRFSAARTSFDKARRSHFAKLEVQRGEATSAKEALIAEAERLSSSTDWGPTAGAYRDLTARWKAAPRGPRREEDAWWARFRAAQDVFFAARAAATEERESGLRANLAAKEALLVEAQALVPITDLESATRALRSVQQRWEAAGAVPRGDRDRVEGGLRRVEEAVRTAEGERWRRTDPAKRAFAASTVEKFQASVAKLEAQLVAAEGAGDAGAASAARAALDGQRELLAAAERSLAEYS